MTQNYDIKTQEPSVGHVTQIFSTELPGHRNKQNSNQTNLVLKLTIAQSTFLKGIQINNFLKMKVMILFLMHTHTKYRKPFQIHRQSTHRTLDTQDIQAMYKLFAWVRRCPKWVLRETMLCLPENNVRFCSWNYFELLKVTLVLPKRQTFRRKIVKQVWQPLVQEQQLSWNTSTQEIQQTITAI